MSVSTLLDPSSWTFRVLIFFAGAWMGRALGRLIQHLAHASGYSSSHYYRLDTGGSFLSLIPVLGHLAGPKAGRSRRAVCIELATGIAFVACWASFPPAKAACGCVLLLGLIGASCIDLDHMIIPDLFTIGLALSGLLLSSLVPALHEHAPFTLFICMRSGAAALLGLAVGSALGLWIALLGELFLGKEVLGFGDVKFLGGIGAFCGWQGAVFSVFGGAIFGAAAIILGEIYRRVAGDSSVQLFRLESEGSQSGKFGWGVHFPFGPMLATAAAAYFLALHPWADHCLGQYLVLF